MVGRFSRRNKRSISKRISHKNKYLRSKRRIKRNIKKGGASNPPIVDKILELLSDGNLFRLKYLAVVLDLEHKKLKDFKLNEIRKALKEDMFDDYSEDRFTKVLSSHASIVGKTKVSASGRVIYEYIDRLSKCASY